MPDKTPGDRLVEEWRQANGIALGVYGDLSRRIDTLLSDQSAGLVLDLRELFSWKSARPRAVYLDEVEAMIRKQLPGVKVLT